MANINIHKIESSIIIIEFDQQNKKINSLSIKIINELLTILEDIDNNPDIKYLIFTSKKKDHFIAGADINEIAQLNTIDIALDKVKIGQNAMNKIENLNCTTIAVINGSCLGGGMELALACDFRIGVNNPKFSLGLPEVSLGLIPGFGGTQRLRNIVGLGNAIEIITSANHINAQDAERLGLANRICDNVLEDSILLCKKISNNSSIAIKNAIQSIVTGMNVSYYESFDIENNLFSQLFEKEDSREGMLAFLERRKPKFKE